MNELVTPRRQPVDEPRAARTRLSRARGRGARAADRARRDRLGARPAVPRHVLLPGREGSVGLARPAAAPRGGSSGSRSPCSSRRAWSRISSGRALDRGCHGLRSRTGSSRPASSSSASSCSPRRSSGPPSSGSGRGGRASGRRSRSSRASGSGSSRSSPPSRRSTCSRTRSGRRRRRRPARCSSRSCAAGSSSPYWSLVTAAALFVSGRVVPRPRAERLALRPLGVPPPPDRLDARRRERLPARRGVQAAPGRSGRTGSRRRGSRWR